MKKKENKNKSESTKTLERQFEMDPTDLLAELAFRVKVLESALIDKGFMKMKDFREIADKVQKEFQPKERKETEKRKETKEEKLSNLENKNYFG
ncbi:MAG: hypothetical protein Q8O03_03960 [Nanoarchaeota archaeon]|nr:hypothetical protein [Nanoarchaeota archaeon]